MVKTVAWAASLGDRSENADYIYGKRRLREIDRRVRFLIKRLEGAEMVNSSGRDTDQVFFGATVKREQRVRRAAASRIVGVDEVDPAHGCVSWVSPIARALIKAREGDTVTLHTPAGEEKLEILEVHVPMSMIKEFREFAVKGNIVDLAVAVIIGAAFGKIVSSLVEDIVMPVVGVVSARSTSRA